MGVVDAPALQAGATRAAQSLDSGGRVSPLLRLRLMGDGLAGRPRGGRQSAFPKSRRPAFRAHLDPMAWSVDPAHCARWQLADISALSERGVLQRCHGTT